MKERGSSPVSHLPSPVSRIIFPTDSPLFPLKGSMLVYFSALKYDRTEYIILSGLSKQNVHDNRFPSHEMMAHKLDSFLRSSNLKLSNEVSETGGVLETATGKYERASVDLGPPSEETIQFVSEYLKLAIP